MKTVEAFRTHFEGLPNNILWMACTAACRGINYTDCTKVDMADAWVKDQYGIGQVDLATLDDHVIALYAAGKMGVKQSAVVFNWISRESLLPKLLKVKRGTKAARAC